MNDMKKTTRTTASLGTLSASLLLLTACAGGQDAPAEQDTTTAPPTASAEQAEESTGTGGADTAPSDDGQDEAAEAAEAPLTVLDSWTKATESGMTGSFATLENTTDQDVHVTGVHSELSPVVELHTMVDDGTGQSVMQEAPDGFTVAAGETHELAPGGDHVMFMDLQSPLAPGDTVDYVLELEDGTEVTVTSEVRDFAGANESYHGGEGESGHEGHGDGEHEDGHEGDEGHDH